MANVTIPEDFLKEALAAALAVQLGDKDALVERLLAMALQRRGSYGRETSLLEDALAVQLDTFVRDVVAGLLAEHEDDIKAALSERLVSTGLIDAAVDALKGSWVFRVNLYPDGES